MLTPEEKDAMFRDILAEERSKPKWAKGMHSMLKDCGLSSSHASDVLNGKKGCNLDIKIEILRRLGRDYEFLIKDILLRSVQDKIFEAIKDTDRPTVPLDMVKKLVALEKFGPDILYRTAVGIMDYIDGVNTQCLQKASGE